MQYYGFNGKILHVDLNDRSWSVESPGENFWRTYAGGGLLATYYLMKRCKPRIDAFSSENLLVLSTSVVSGQPYAGLARFTASAKSPLTGGIGETRCEGPFAGAMKSSGFDAVVVTGVCDNPATLLIDRGTVKIGDASDIWGQTTSRCNDDLQSEFGADASTAVIGPAGENLVRFASIVVDRNFQASRMGMGAVMGSKRLKAIIVKGGELPPVADAESCEKLTISYRDRMLQNPLTKWQAEPPGFSAWVHVHGTDAALCVRNYRDSVFENARNYAPGNFMKRYLKDEPCPGCPNNCIKIFAGDRDARVDRFANAAGLHQEATGALGSNLGLERLDDVLQANLLCSEFGMDPTSIGFTMSMAAECIERGILSEETVGMKLRFGNADAFLGMIEKIAKREGFGDALAEGTKLATEIIGEGSKRYAMQVKGLEMVVFEPRTQTNLALGYATAPIGPRYDICEHDWDYDTEVGWPHTMEGSRTLGILERIPMQYLGIGKVRNFKALNTIWSAADALDLCIFAVAPTRVFSLAEMAELVAAVTGWNTSSHEIMRLGERRNNLMRAYNAREGFTAADDGLPDRFFDDPIPQGSWSGTSLDRDLFGKAIAAYYRMMGWNEHGNPLYETLVDQDLQWVFDEGHLPA